MRHGDVLTRHWRELWRDFAPHPLEAHVDAALALLSARGRDARAASVADRVRLFLMTDDAGVVARARSLVAARRLTAPRGAPRLDIVGVPNAARGGHGALGAPAHEPAGARGARPLVANATDWGLASSSSRALVDILTELELARRCEAFVGNCASLFSHAVLRAMCAAGDECPPHYSMTRDVRCCG